MSTSLEDVVDEVSLHLEEISSLFKEGNQLTLLVRFPGEPDKDFVLSSEEDLSEVAASLTHLEEKRKEDS